MFGDNFQAIIATHTNTENYHNHIVVNAYSINGEFKYHDKKATMARMKELNDKISLAHGLEIVVNPDLGKTHSYKEYLEIKNGTSWKEQIRQDIKSSMQLSTSFEEFKSYMEEVGYTIKENERSISYQMEDSDKKVRDITLGKEFTKAELEKYWTQSKAQEIKENMDKMLDVKKKESLYVSKYDINGRKRSILEIFLLKAIKILKRLREFLKTEEEKKTYDLKIQGLIDSMQKAEDLGIGTREELLEQLTETGKKLALLKAENSSKALLIDSFNEIYEEVQQYEDLKDKVVSLGLNPSDLDMSEYTREEIRANRTKLSPMTNKQKQALFSLIDKEEYYKLDCKFDEISREEGDKLIEFLNDKTKEKPSILITIEEFEHKRLVKKYEMAAKKRLEAMKNKLSTPLTQTERDNLLKMVGEREVDVVNATKYDYIRVMNYVNRKNPLLTPAKSSEPIDSRIKEQLIDLLKIYPEEDINGISKNLDTLDNERAKKLYNYLLEMNLVPEILTEDKEDIYYRLVEDLEPEEQELCNQFRYISEQIQKYGITDTLVFKAEIMEEKERLEESLREYKELAATYGDLQYIKRNEEYCRSEKFLYGDFDKDMIEVEEIERAKEGEEEYIKPRKNRGISI
jgi:hypothetical protein